MSRTATPTSSCELPQPRRPPATRRPRRTRRAPRTGPPATPAGGRAAPGRRRRAPGRSPRGRCAGTPRGPLAAQTPVPAGVRRARRRAVARAEPGGVVPVQHGRRRVVNSPAPSASSAAPAVRRSTQSPASAPRRRSQRSADRGSDPARRGPPSRPTPSCLAEQHRVLGGASPVVGRVRSRAPLPSTRSQPPPPVGRRRPSRPGCGPRRRRPPAAPSASRATCRVEVGAQRLVAPHRATRGQHRRVEQRANVRAPGRHAAHGPGDPAQRAHARRRSRRRRRPARR